MATPIEQEVLKKKRCFVVMGFGTKTDYATGRKLDLNKSYRLLIKPVVEQKGLECLRADEIRHSGSIDLHMYQELLNADVVVADLSTANANALYELGIRHAMRPFTTIVISEDKLVYPFDLNHITITSYTHLGDAIDFDEVERFRKILGDKLQAVLDKQEPDSPVYTYLSQLVPPSIAARMQSSVPQIAAVTVDKTASGKALSAVLDEGEEAIAASDFEKAKRLFASALVIGKSEGDSISNDPYIIQSLALATYKAEKPTKVLALKEALNLLRQLDLDHTNDPETVSLAGSIEKKLYECGEGEYHLSNSILFYQRGYFLLNNRYNAINLAFTLNYRANSSLCKTIEEQIADMVYAGYTRQRTLMICDRDWNELIAREKPQESLITDNAELKKQYDYNTEQKFWIKINKAEAYFGLGNFEAYKTALAEASAIEHAGWMMEGFNRQIEKLRILLQETGHLLNPLWEEPV
jgi:hypothetical protein